ncbi:MAG: DUF47 family protein [Acidimicrobiales bacterium]
MAVKHWFLPDTPDVVGMLRAQVAVTAEGLDALVRWAESGGDDAAADAVRDAEHRADAGKRELRRALRAAFTTPLDAEDLYWLSERLDVVMNGAKDTVREAEVMAAVPDAPVLEMARLLRDGVGHLADAVDHLVDDGDEATVAADAAVKSQRGVERVYRRAMSDLLELDDLREVMARREVYRRLSRVGDTVVEVAERVWYAVVKEA